MLRILLTFACLTVFLLALEIPRHAGFGPNWIAYEALLLSGLFALLPPSRWRSFAAWLTGALFALLALLAMADALARYSLARPLNIYLDLQLASSVYALIAGNVNPFVAFLGAAAGMLILVGLAALVYWLLNRLRVELPTRTVRATALTMLLGAGIGILNFQLVPTAPNLPRAITPGLTLALDQARWGIWTHRESRAFEAMLAAEPAQPEGRRLDGLAGIDVTLGFIESYGVSAVFDARYAPVIQPRLHEMEQRIKAAGLHMITGSINAPMFGGQSWLAHGTMLSGLWLDNHIRYELMLASNRQTLVDDFRNTGHTTVTIMPAIVGPWPEGLRFGYDRIYAAANIDYAGPPFNWVTMPDQFTWSFFQEQVRSPALQPLFAKLALISSHAPWVPILPVIDDWDSIKDGRIFNQWEGKGEAPEVLWQNHDRVREHYALSVDYALAVAMAYAERYVDEKHLLILVGDHQPAPIITGRNPSAAATMHIISADPALLQPFLQHGFRPGAFPDAEYTRNRMADFRQWLHAAYGAR